MNHGLVVNGMAAPSATVRSQVSLAKAGKARPAPRRESPGRLSEVTKTVSVDLGSPNWLN